MQKQSLEERNAVFFKRLRESEARLSNAFLRNDWYEIAQLVRDNVVDWTRAMIFAADENSVPLIDVLLNMGITNAPHVPGNALVRAVGIGSAAVVKRLSSDPSVTQESRTEAFLKAVQRGEHPEIVRLFLLNSTVDVSVLKDLRYARFNADILRLFLDIPRIHYRSLTFYPRQEVEDAVTTRRDAFQGELSALLSAIRQSELRKPPHERFPREIRRQITLERGFAQACSDLQSTHMPSVELEELARIMRLDITGLSKQDACRVVRQELLNTMYR